MRAGAAISVLLAPVVLLLPQSHAAAATTGGGSARSGLPPELTAGNPSGPLITPVQAIGVVEALWPLREKALAADDISMTDQLEDGVAREFDDAVSAFDHHIPAGSRLRRIRSHGPVTVLVPRQTGFPARFLAAVPTSVYATVPGESVAGAPYVELLVMTRHDATAPWTLSLDTGYQGTVPVTAPVDEAGFTADPPPPAWVDVGAVHPLLGGYLQHWKEQHAAPTDSPFLPGVWTTQRGVGLTPQDAFSAHCGCFEHTEYHADPNRDGLFQFAWTDTPTSQPVDLVCSTLRIHDVWRPQPGHLLRQDETRTNWGGGLRPGLYRSLTTDALRQTCITVGTTRTLGLDVIGGNGDFVRETGQPASPAWILTFHARIGLPFLLAAVVIAMILVTLIAVRSRRPAPIPPWPGSAPPYGPPPSAPPEGWPTVPPQRDRWC